PCSISPSSMAAVRAAKRPALAFFNLNVNRIVLLHVACVGRHNAGPVPFDSMLNSGHLGGDPLPSTMQPYKVLSLSRFLLHSTISRISEGMNCCSTSPSATRLGLPHAASSP